MTMRYVDTHSHLHFPQYDADREAVLARMREREVGTIVVGTSYKTSEQAALLADMHEDIWATIGVHPTDTDETFDASEYAKFLSPNVVGVGECGLDYFRGARSGLKPKQEQIFEAQIAFAVEHDLPMMLHVRPSADSEDAHEDALAMLANWQRREGDKVRGNAHFFTGSPETARKYWGMGFTTAFPGVITFAKELEEVVREAPLDMILSETDAPYAAPVPYRGKRNEPAYVIEVVHAIAAIRNEPEERVERVLVENAKRVFGL